MHSFSQIGSGQNGSRRGVGASVLNWFSMGVCVAALSVTAYGQFSEAKLAELRDRVQRDGGTFTVGPNPATYRSMDQLCGLVPPKHDGQPSGDVNPPGGGDDHPHLWGLPQKFSWLDQGGCTPIRDQRDCGACWAFATVGPLECNILIRDGKTVDLSEQWLVSCNQEYYGCMGGWMAMDYFVSKADPCGGIGAVLESEFPYAAADLPCGCPYTHPYTIKSWAFVGNDSSVPPTESIKQAIMDYGPVGAGVCVDDLFSYYTGGIFNLSANGEVNHGIVLVGWDDTQGSHGVWILRNSWGPSWGESGYMRIEYGCSSVGFSAARLDYPGSGGGGGGGSSSPAAIQVTPASIAFGNVTVGQSATQTFVVKNVGEQLLSGTASGLGAPFSFQGSTTYSLAGGESQTITVRFAPSMQGTFTDVVNFTGGGDANANVTGTGTGTGPAELCAGAPTVGAGTFTGSNVGAATDATPSCGGTNDVWWRYTALTQAIVTIDTCGSDFDTVLTVYSSCGGAEVACNNDYADCPTNAHASQVSFPVTAGAIYYIRVAGGTPPTGNIVLNVATNIPKHTISGKITGPDGKGLAGVTLTGLPGSPVTDDQGQYSASVDYGFTGTATPRKTKYGFSPSSRGYTNLTTDLANQDYVATPPTLTIAGHVTDDSGAALAGVSIMGLPGNPISGASGQYQASVPFGYTGSASPSMAARSFDPPLRTYQNLTADLMFEDFVGTLQTGSLTVVLDPQAARDAGAQWQVDNGGWQTSGQTVTGLSIGRHTVDFLPVSGWVAPGSEQVSIDKDQTTQLDRSYQLVTYVLTLGVNPSGAGDILAEPAADPMGRYLGGTLVKMTARPNSGYRVRDWVGADQTPASGSETNTATMVAARTVIVNFEAIPYQMYQLQAYVVGGHGTVDPTYGSYKDGTLVVITATPETGYVVKAWTGTTDDTSALASNMISMTAARTVTVEFEQWHDVNGNGVLDRLDILNGTSADTNGNGVPDETEPGLNNGDNTNGDSGNNNTDNPSPPRTSHGLCGFGLVDSMLLTGLGLALLKRRR